MYVPITFYILCVVATLIGLAVYNYLEVNFKDNLNSSQKSITIILTAMSGVIYIIFGLYLISVDIFNENNISITTFIVTLTTLIFQQTLPKALSFVILSKENTTKEEYKNNGEIILSKFKLLNSVVTFFIIFLIIFRLAHLLLSKIVYINF